MGGEAPNPQEKWVEQMVNFLSYLPALSRTSTEATTTALPQLSSAGLTNLQQYALPYAQVGTDVQRQNAMAGAQTNADVLAGPGAQIARNATAINKEANPEWYNVRGLSADQTSNLLKSINLNGLAPGEHAAVERSLNQSRTATGNLGLDNATNAVAEAMQFGGAMQQKRDALGSALGTAANFMNSAQSTSFNPVALALSQPAPTTQENFGTSQFTGVGPVMGQTGQNSNALLGSATANNTTNQSLEAQASYNRSFAGIMGSMPSYS